MTTLIRICPEAKAEVEADQLTHSSLKPFLEKKNFVKLEIEDTGKGIPDEEKKGLFIPFYTSTPKGSGLGLPVSKKIITDHKGTIEVQSQINVGTKFTIFLPLDD